jgi:hypothetical protein
LFLSATFIWLQTHQEDLLNCWNSKASILVSRGVNSSNYVCWLWPCFRGDLFISVNKGKQLFILSVLKYLVDNVKIRKKYEFCKNCRYIFKNHLTAIFHHISKDRHCSSMSGPEL